MYYERKVRKTDNFPSLSKDKVCIIVENVTITNNIFVIKIHTMKWTSLTRFRGFIRVQGKGRAPTKCTTNYPKILG